MSVAYRFGDCLERTKAARTVRAEELHMVNAFDTPERLDKKDPLIFRDVQFLVVPT
jgi:hypothetical protein